ncbi:Decapping and exoribonuclease protein [Orchesella cincta]|uniref:Decapping nuclease n=1 Tax=Orchesella cincta TaxID=48709 RepID=A0A1D2MCG6_ORCCI|nr:Decapping and exoribonuclease protein [Orchesella cincta]
MELEKEREIREPRKRTHAIAFDKFNITMERISENTPFPSFSKPWVAGCFSLDGDRKYLEGPQFLKFCHMPTTPAVKYDLNKQAALIRSLYTDSNEEESRRQTSELLHLLFWARKHKERFKRWRPHFVFYRGLMTKLLGTPYENQDGWKIAAMMRTKTIYLRELDTPESAASRQKFNSKPFLRKTAEWGRAFEYFLLSDEPESQPDPNGVKKEECNIVFRTKLGSHDLLYAAEVDGIIVKDGNEGNPKKQPELIQSSELVEIKTTRQFPSSEMPHKFRRFNLRKWWCQCFTAGISQVVVGFRDDDGMVEEVKSYPVDQLPKMGADWSSTVCFNFLDQFLSEIKRIIADDVTSVFILEFRPQKHSLQGVLQISVTVEKDSDKYLPSII